MDHFIVFCSPNGSTRHVAEVIGGRLLDLGYSAVLVDLMRMDHERAIKQMIQSPELPKCLWVGSPVYVDHIVPPVDNLIRSLLEHNGSFAIPFVTWGGVNSGVALYEMGEKLTQKKFILLGAAKVLAVHSSTWQSSQPLCAGHPDKGDDAMINRLVCEVHTKLSCRAIKPLALEVLDYQSQEIKDAASKKTIALAKQNYPAFSVRTESCNQCGICAENCPAQAIALNPYPQFGEDCFVCLKCVRECPQEAIPMDMSAAEERIRGMAAGINEKPPTCIFL
jgi:ferredoxin